MPKASKPRSPKQPRRGRPIHCGLTPEEWTRLWEAQGRSCAICGHPLRSPFDPSSTGRQANVDHCHEAEKTVGLRASIRGLLCGYPCNRDLWQRWTADKLARASVYVETFPAQAVLGPADPNAPPPQAVLVTDVVIA